MVDIANHHLLDHPCSHARVVGVLPSRQLIQNIEAKTVAIVQKMLIGRVVRHPYSIHIHPLHKQDVLTADRIASTATRIRPKRMTAAAFEYDLTTVDKDAGPRAQLYCTEAEPGCRSVQYRGSGHETDLQLI